MKNDLNKVESAYKNKPLEQTVYYVENDLGEKCFYDTKVEKYYFGKKTIGYCFWESEEKASFFINEAKFENNPVVKPITKTYPSIN